MAGRLDAFLQALPRWLPRKPRTFLALVLVILVVVILGLGKLLDRPTSPSNESYRPDSSSSQATTDPASGDDGVAAPQATPSPLQPSGGPEAIAVAVAFAKSWLEIDRSAEAWRTALLPHSTENLAASLLGVDPANVPASRITGDAKVESHANIYVDVVIPMDAGLLRLRLLAPQDANGQRRWLVDGIDWERA